MLDEGDPGGDEFVGERGEDGGVGVGFLEEGVSGLEGADVALEEGEVAGLGLGEDEIEEASTDAAGAFDELEVFGAEDDAAEAAVVIGEATDGLVVEGEAFLGGGPVDLEVVFGLGDEGAADEVAFGAVAVSIWGAADAAEGAAAWRGDRWPRGCWFCPGRYRR